MNTFGGHPAAYGMALKNLEIIKRENLVERPRLFGDRLPSEVRGLPRHSIAGCNKALTLSRPRCRVPDVVDR